ncbi:MAG: hypothetical protein L6V93_03810 [Clostridiales bacterium]|nr:MAG: hypothetical protein L6V93_03810 [Clostridiales bacterium]
MTFSEKGGTAERVTDFYEIKIGTSKSLSEKQRNQTNLLFADVEHPEKKLIATVSRK